jgi:hypothetical protein
MLKTLQGFLASPGMPQLYATRVLHATGKLWGAKLLLEMALIAQKKMDEAGQDHFDYAFYQGKVASARFFARNILPEIGALAEILKTGDSTALEAPESIFSA